MDGPLETLFTTAGQVCIDPATGGVSSLAFRLGGAMQEILHRAHWVGAGPEAIPSGTALVEQRLAGDFFCAPFGNNDLLGGPIHGPTANTPWISKGVRQGEPGPSVTFELAETVMEAHVTKTVCLSQHAPVLYQTHRIEGGTGGLTVAHHPMLRLAADDRISTSPKRLALTPDVPLVDGRNWLDYPARGTDLTRFPGRAGPVDLTRYPAVQGHEDFITLVEARGTRLGWTAVLRERDLVFVLKDPRVLPVTMLWWSNGGRDALPWDGRHLGVLGIEDGCAAGAAGHAAALIDNAISAEGVRTSLSLGAETTHRIRHAIGAVPRPAGWSSVRDIALVGEQLVVTGDTGETQMVSFDGAFFG